MVANGFFNELADFVFADLQRRITTNGNDYLKRVDLYVQEYGLKGTELTHLVKLRRVNHPNNCLTLDIAQILLEEKEHTKDTPTDIVFVFNLTTYARFPFSAHLHIDPKESFLERESLIGKTSSNGDHIEKLDMGNVRYKSYAINFKQNIFVEEDKSIGCKNYPTAEFETYNDCDQAAMLTSVLKPPYPSGFTPVFMTDSPKNVTSGPVFIKNELPDYWGFISYKIPKHCPKPCIHTISSVTFLTEGKYFDNVSVLELMLPETMLVTKNSYPSFSLVELFAGLGGSMGLWLGLGALQLLQGLQQLVRRSMYRGPMLL